MIHVTDLRYAWPGATSDTVHIPALSIPSGQRVFLQGPSGCGKSTFLSLLAGVLAPLSGQVRVLDTDVSTLSGVQRDQFRADHIGFIFQQFNLLGYLHAIDNVCMPCTFSKLRRQQAISTYGSILESAQSLLNAMQLPPSLWQRPSRHLSVGQQQRVAAARALMGQPPLILADEPTSALDNAHCASFMAQLVAACTAGTPTTLIMVSHDDRLAHHFDCHLTWPSLNR